MEKLAQSVFSKIDEASPKDTFWLYQSLSKKRINNNGPFTTNKPSFDLYRNEVTYFSDYIEDETQAILDALDFGIND